ncbi:Uncharacterised protein [Mycobacterium tuberculosis]|uniref:Uncharacterized protein n=1 Tax=Mycobacterium tuberculosis TaxID=1773 RepID=A0A654ZDX0_MYCTX|nr:Uncharacterised protein [Mycobacterium tuberculosis]CKR41741.1 Uncharacterised protein [Mycobacterium tuberculosis]
MFVLPLIIGHLDGEHGICGAGPIIIAAEEIELPQCLGLLGAQHRVHRIAVHQEKTLAGMPQRVERTRLDQRFGHLLVARRDVDLVQVVRKVGELALVVAGLEQRAHDISANVAHRAQPVADVLADRCEVQARFVDVGREHGDAELAAVGQINRGLVFIVADRRQQTGHVLGGIVGLEVGRPVGHHAVAGGM